MAALFQILIISTMIFKMDLEAMRMTLIKMAKMIDYVNQKPNTDEV